MGIQCSKTTSKLHNFASHKMNECTADHKGNVAVGLCLQT